MCNYTLHDINTLPQFLDISPIHLTEYEGIFNLPRFRWKVDQLKPILIALVGALLLEHNRCKHAHHNFIITEKNHVVYTPRDTLISHKYTF